MKAVIKGLKNLIYIIDKYWKITVGFMKKDKMTRDGENVKKDDEMGLECHLNWN
jgi:hypothetical protein